MLYFSVSNYDKFLYHYDVMQQYWGRLRRVVRRVQGDAAEAGRVRVTHISCPI